jgi:maltooligosyltrehalose trehalohydrolase
MTDVPRLGASVLDGGRCRFLVWAPSVRHIDLHLLAPVDRTVPMARDDAGFHEIAVDGCPPGSRYRYRLDGDRERPDPASRFQPEGVHGPSEVVADAFPWRDAGWTGIPLRDAVFYELHVGTFTPEGTLDAVIPRLPDLRDLGVTVVELMPVAQFPGGRNWGYDGAYPYAVQCTYGGPEGLKRLVDACHAAGLAVALDVVHNHLGPEGSYLGELAPCFTDRYRTPWGDAINFDGPGSDEVRRFFIGSALQWVGEFHVDALRLDAVHAIHDRTAVPFLQELAAAVRREAGRRGSRVHVIAESNLNDPRLIRPVEAGGLGLDGQWSDDFHHALHALLTGERGGCYADFGRVEPLARAWRQGYALTGQVSAYRRRRHGSDPRGCRAEQFVVCAQDHDQVGNRARGDRLATLVPFEALKLAAGTVILSPFLPLLFMGEEYGETAPFPYFVSHGDPALIEAVRAGRRRDLAAVAGPDEVPDPQDEATFRSARLRPELAASGRPAALRAFTRELLALRRARPELAKPDWAAQEVVAREAERVLTIHRPGAGEAVFAAFHYGPGATVAELPLPGGAWRKVIDSADGRWLGPGSAVPDAVRSTGAVPLTLAPWSAVVLERTGS